MKKNEIIPVSYNNWREVAMTFRRKEGAKAVRDMIKRGDLPQAKKCKCVDCGKRASCYDHRDYRKPTVVDPVCSKCNGIRGIAKPYMDMGSKSYKKLLKRAKEWYHSNSHRKNRKDHEKLIKSIPAFRKKYSHLLGISNDAAF